MPALSRRTSGDGGGRRRTRVPLSRRFTYRYALALLVFTVIAVLWKISLDASAQRVDDLSRQTSAAALQPTRVAKISELSNRIVGQTPDADQQEIRTAASSLTQESVLLQQVQKGLIDGDPSLGLPAVPLSPSLQKLYMEPDRLKQTVDEIGRAGQAIADFNAPSQNNAETRATELKVITQNQDEAVKGLEKALKYYVDDIQAQLETQHNNNQIFIGLSLIATAGIVLFLFRPMARSIHLETSQLETAERVQRENSERQSFRNELSQALEVTDSEGEVLAAVGRALMTVVPDNPAELLLADASGSHLRRAQVSPSRGAAGCPVDTQLGCAAIRRAQTVVYESSRMLNVCPKLPQHEPGVCSAVCVPVMFMGNAIGVLHAVGPDGAPPSHTEIERLSVLGAETGSRISMLRTSRATELQASTDGLTGLDNRRSLETKARSLLLDEQPFSVAMADLDNFKTLNDTYGHETGDRALRLFSAVLREALRPEDISARYGGEEFVVLLPHTSIAEAIRAVERLQEALDAEVRRSGTVGFTASWGLTNDSSGSTFDEIVAVADAALYSAKRAGRNCIMVDGEAAAAAGLNVSLPDADGHTDGDGRFDGSRVQPRPAHGEDDRPLLEIDMERLEADIARRSEAT